MTNNQTNETLKTIALRIKKNLPLNEYEKAMWTLYRTKTNKTEADTNNKQLEAYNA